MPELINPQPNASILHLCSSSPTAPAHCPLATWPQMAGQLVGSSPFPCTNHITPEAPRYSCVLQAAYCGDSQGIERELWGDDSSPHTVSESQVLKLALHHIEQKKKKYCLRARFPYLHGFKSWLPRKIDMNQQHQRQKRKCKTRYTELQETICQQVRKPRRNGYNFGHTKSTKNESWSN